MKNKKKKDGVIPDELSVTAREGEPETVYDMVNKYGTYEIQPTAATDNQYPAIAQGFNKKQIKNDCRNPVDK